MKFTRFVSAAVLLTLVLTTLCPACAFADADDSPEAGFSHQLQQSDPPASDVFEDISPEPVIITGFEQIPGEIASQTITAGSGQDPTLPETLGILTQGEAESVSISASWESLPVFDKQKCGKYIFQLKLPEGYMLNEGISLPEIRVEVVKTATAVSGLKLRHKIKSRSSLSDKITVSPAQGRTLRLQMKSGGKWVTKKTYTLPEKKRGSLEIAYPSDWWKLPSSSWRITISGSNTADAFTSSSITVLAQKYYQNPSNYIQLKNEITLKDSAGYNLGLGHMGLRVRKVNSYFHIGDRYFPRYTRETKQRVTAFQRKNNLKATGVVNLSTWKAMGFSENSWYTLGAYVSPIQVNPSSTKKDHIEAMIRTAKTYLGADYVVGASGSPSQGADCSGLIMQGLYAAGADPYPVSCLRHSKPGYEYESRNLWADKRFKTIPYTKKKRGDLVFYRGRGGAIIHVAIYLGNGKVIESWPNKVVIWPIKNSRRNRIAGIKRVFN